MALRTATRLLDELVNADGLLDPVAYRAAHLDRTQVARCWCGGPVVTDPNEPEYSVDQLGVRWYSMRCLSGGHTVEQPATRQLRTDRERPSRSHTARVLEHTARRLGDR